ncbi:DUF4102 domain-containing protein [Mariprofundus erugo]|nr:DUF4102 domain-containing protein [Mariprofundus erugo]
MNAPLIRAAKPEAKQKKLVDGAGLFLLLHPNGGKYWRMNYRFAGRQCTVAPGVYPDVSLKMARGLRGRGQMPAYIYRRVGFSNWSQPSLIARVHQRTA